jgi:hypothetical protein
MSRPQLNKAISRGVKVDTGAKNGGKEESNNGMFDRLTYDYIEVTNKTTLIFSQLPPDEIAAQLTEKLIDLDCSPQVNENKWKFNFTLTRDLSDQEKESEVEAVFCTV